MNTVRSICISFVIVPSVSSNLITYPPSPHFPSLPSFSEFFPSRHVWTLKLMNLLLLLDGVIAYGADLRPLTSERAIVSGYMGTPFRILRPQKL